MSDSGRNQTHSLNPIAEAEEEEFYRKVIEWRISEKVDDEEEDSAYESSCRSHSELFSLSQCTEICKSKVPPLHLVPGEKYNCSISSVFSPTSFLLRRNDEEFFKLTRLECVSRVTSREYVIIDFYESSDFLLKCVIFT